jgi:hypothetical protein
MWAFPSSGLQARSSPYQHSLALRTLPGPRREGGARGLSRGRAGDATAPRRGSKGPLSPAASAAAGDGSTVLEFAP